LQNCLNIYVFPPNDKFVDEDIDVYAEKAHIVLEENEQDLSSDNPSMLKILSLFYGK